MTLITIDGFFGRDSTHAPKVIVIETGITEDIFVDPEIRITHIIPGPATSDSHRSENHTISFGRSHVATFANELVVGVVRCITAELANDAGKMALFPYFFVMSRNYLSDLQDH